MFEMKLNNRWQELLSEEFNANYFSGLEQFLEKEYREKRIFPARQDIWNAFKYTDYDEVKVLLLGQDPYHGEGLAHGLSFSVQPGVRIPPSLRNIYKELQADLGIPIPETGYLKKWAEEGVMLLNTVLTVREGEANSHRGKGWEKLTDKAISLLNEREKPVIFLLWGRPAQEKQRLIDTSRHVVIASPHPSPLSANRGFFGSAPFSKVNAELRRLGMKEIDWSLD